MLLYSVNQIFRNLKSIENKSNEEQSLQKVLDNDQPKKKKNNLKNIKQEYIRACKVNKIDPQAINSSARSFKDGVKCNNEWNKEKQLPKKLAAGDV